MHENCDLNLKLYHNFNKSWNNIEKIKGKALTLCNEVTARLNPHVCAIDLVVLFSAKMAPIFKAG